MASHEIQTPSQQLLPAIRQAMQSQQLDWLIVPSSDEFLSEYVPPHLNRRQALTGFTGSAGDALLGLEEVWLFVDGRYHEQVDTEVDQALFNTAKLGQDGVLSLTKTLAKLAKEANDDKPINVGVPANCVAQYHLNAWQKAIKSNHINWVLLDEHPLDVIWESAPTNPRPAFQPSPWFEIAETAAGQSVADKLTDLRQAMADENITHYPLTALDEIAWLFNIRANDIKHTPVGLAYGWVTADVAILVAENIPANLNSTLNTAGVDITNEAPATFWALFQQELSKKGATKLWIDPKRTPARLTALAEATGAIVHNAPSPIELAKAIKNSAELRGMEEAHLAASVALITAWHRLETTMASGTVVTEGDFAKFINEAYAAHPAFKELSFPSIVGTGANGAIVHYHTGNSATEINAGELVLFDSGAQYYHQSAGWMGTTDTTRTVLAGDAPATTEQQCRYTQVLRAHLNLGRQKFPKGINGAQLDAICRSTLWNDGVDFLHGTGHGVGCFLGVHEGPCGVSKGYTAAFKPGMITSNEPGYYKSGWGGIRLENLMVCVESSTKLSTTKEAMLAFKNLIYVPFDHRLIDVTLLTAEEKATLNDYHQKVLALMLPKLDASMSWWLMDKCKEL